MTAAAILGAVLAPLLTYITAVQIRQARQLAEHRAELDAAAQREGYLWGYVRALIDQVYRLGGQPVDPPDYLTDLFPSSRKADT